MEDGLSLSPDRNCTLCPLYKNVNTVCLMGGGSAKYSAILIGEAPGREEDEKGSVFIGRAGRLLNGALCKAGLSREEVYVTNIVKCRPPNNRTPINDEILACVPAHLQRELDFTQPKFICLLGNTALHALTDIEIGISKARGKIAARRTLFQENSFVFCTYHPAAALRSKETREYFLVTLITLQKSCYITLDLMLMRLYN